MSNLVRVELREKERHAVLVIDKWVENMPEDLRDYIVVTSGPKFRDALTTMLDTLSDLDWLVYLRAEGDDKDMVGNWIENWSNVHGTQKGLLLSMADED